MTRLRGTGCFVGRDELLIGAGERRLTRWWGITRWIVGGRDQ